MSLARRARRTAPSVREAFLLASALAIFLPGCAPVPATTRPPGAPGRAVPAPGQRPRPGYDARRDALATPNAAALAGRRIVLDPGHGGFFRGSLGVAGLTEAEVNLGVALHLRGLLEARGAIVQMTRTDDRDFLTQADSTLRSDLAERTRIGNEFRPDIFVSIHHNADARGAHDVNETQTYYKLGDEGPSLDAAESIHRYLVRNLGIEKHRILPGNYYVLRNSEAPALLTEASYVTNPDVESKLALAAKQRLEAEALYLGIAHWFARPRPEVTEFVALGDGGRADTLFTTGAPRLIARVRGAFDRAVIAIDGQPVAHTRTDTTLATGPLRLAAGSHVATLDVRLAASGSARRRTLPFRIARPPGTLRADAFPNAGNASLIAVRVLIEDSAGLPLGDSLAVRVATRPGAVLPAETTLVARDGVAWAYFRTRRALVGSIEFTPSISGRAGLTLRSAKFQAASDTPVLGMWLTRAPGDSSLRLPGPSDDADLSIASAPWVNRDGFALCTRDATGRLVGPRVPGHRPATSFAEADLVPVAPMDRVGPEPRVQMPALLASVNRAPRSWVPIAGGALHGRRIVLDPDGGGENDAGTGTSGTRAANLNLDVARALAGFLEAAGAQVRMTRDGDFALSEVERVQVSEAFGADRFLRLGHRAEPAMFGHWFSSAGGKRWAERTAAVFTRLGLAAPAVSEDAQYPLQQTSCPALYASPARIDDPAAEARYLEPATARAEAYALFVALAREWSDVEWPIDSLSFQLEGRPAAGSVVTLGDAFVLLTDASGRVRFARTEPGPIQVTVKHPGLPATTSLLDSKSGRTVTGTSER